MLSILIDQLLAGRAWRPPKPAPSVAPVTHPSGWPRHHATIEVLMRDQKPRSTRAIADATGVDRAIVTTATARMARKGLLRRHSTVRLGRCRSSCVVWVWIPEADRG